VFIRRTLFRWQFPAVIVLPLWLMIGSSIFGSGGWAVLGIFFGAVLLGLGLLAVSGLIFARREVREQRAVSWPDVGVLGLWHLLIIALGFSEDPSGWLSVLVVVVGIGAFWYAVWALFDAARKRVRAMIVLLEETAAGNGPGGPTMPTMPTFGRAVDAETIVIKEKPTDTP